MLSILAGHAMGGEGGTDAPAIRFEERAAEAGIRFTHRTRDFSGLKDQVLEMFTSGGASVAVDDFDGDGYEDIFLTSSAHGTSSVLLRSRRGRTFEDVTERAGVGGGNDESNIVSDGLWFDYDNDGDSDLLVVRFGTPLLYRNDGGGRFSDVSASSGMDRFANSIAAIAFDFDSDGRLDVLLGNYFTSVNLLKLEDFRVLPDNLDDAHNGGGVTLWRNLGGGRFADATQTAGLAGQSGWVLDVGHGDFDNDGDPDLYLAADFGTDRLYFNNGDGTFSDATEEGLGGLDTKKGMNAEVADYDNDGWLDVYVTNITDEYMKECNMLWHNNGDGTFTDLSKETGTCNTLWGWGAKFADFDNDGLQDLYAVNGMRSAGEGNYIPVLFEMLIQEPDFSDVRSWPDIEGMSWSGYQPSKLFRNLGAGLFREMAAQAGVDSRLDGRGVAVADLDRDGRLDLLVSNADQRALYYRNTTQPQGDWIGLRLIGSPAAGSNRDAIGARVTLSYGGITRIREVQGGNGYSGQSSKALHFGLGIAAEASEAGTSESTPQAELTIRWPNGDTETRLLPINTFSTLSQAKSLSTEGGAP
ncbi:MAG TPA: CRTAC1 family protein [Acidobacteriota bacterium]|nr:CRTAC1 family protein [Acidobacteriota bacterium]